jgi:antitoxin (DNA-binding transcriptional repressor) of toxin-antitoxin stability system
MKPFTVHAAKTHLSRLIAKACAGEEVVIARGKTPLVRLVPIAGPNEPPIGRIRGAAKGLGYLDDSFFDPLPESELALWEGRGPTPDPLDEPLPKAGRARKK